MELFNTYISKESKKLVQQVLESGFINEGIIVRNFERALSKYGLVNPITVNSCTSALHIALLCCNVKGKEVILPAQGFISTGLAVLMAGGIPRFVDIDENGNILVEEIAKVINHNTGAIIVVHWGGIPCDIIKINKLSQYYEISVIEDAAHAFGARACGQLIGNISDYTCFSLQAIKFLTSGDGGIICTKHPDKIDLIKKLKWFGINRNEIERNYLGERCNDVGVLGYKYNMNDITAAIGLGNLHSVDWRLKVRRDIAERYQNEIKWPIMSPATFPPDKPSYWLYTIKVKKRNEFILAMNSAGIPTSVVDRRIDKHSIFKQTPQQQSLLVGQEWFDNHQISIPIHEQLCDDDVNHIIDTINKIGKRL